MNEDLPGLLTNAGHHGAKTHWLGIIFDSRASRDHALEFTEDIVGGIWTPLTIDVRGIVNDLNCRCCRSKNCSIVLNEHPRSSGAPQDGTQIISSGALTCIPCPLHTVGASHHVNTPRTTTPSRS